MKLILRIVFMGALALLAFMLGKALLPNDWDGGYFTGMAVIIIQQAFNLLFEQTKR